MDTTFKFFWLLLVGFVLCACRSAEVIHVSATSAAASSSIPTIQPYSPILVGTPTPDSVAVTFTSTPYIPKANSQDGATVEEIEQTLTLKPNNSRSQLVELNCSTVDNAVHCIDDYLGIEFTLPEAWTPLTSELRRNPLGGSGYSYHFSSEGIRIYGVSANYVLGMGGWLYRGENPLTFCNERLSAALCKEVQPNVVFLIGIPSVRTLCSWQQDIFPIPQAIALIALPDHPTINGLVVDVELMSESLRHELTALTPDRSNYAPCRLEDWAALSDRYALLVDQIIEGSLDPDSQRNLDSLRIFATSLIGNRQTTGRIDENPLND